LETPQRQEKFSFFRQSTILCLLVAFIGIKGLQHFLREDILRHLMVAILLMATPVVFGGASIFESFRGALKARLRWEDILVLAFLLLPVVCNILFLPASWHETRLNWQNWVWSELGLLSLLAAPIAEEYFFRSWLLQRQLKAELEQTTQSLWGMVRICYLNALLFWIMHMPIDLNQWMQALRIGAVPASPGPFLLGLVTCGLTIRTGNIRAAIFFHGIANASGPLWWPLLGSDFVRSFFYN
jgi:membrane protease YdiL (CAAX protease family)